MNYYYDDITKMYWAKFRWSRWFNSSFFFLFQVVLCALCALNNYWDNSVSMVLDDLIMQNCFSGFVYSLQLNVTLLHVYVCMCTRSFPTIFWHITKTYVRTLEDKEEEHSNRTARKPFSRNKAVWSEHISQHAQILRKILLSLRQRN